MQPACLTFTRVLVANRGEIAVRIFRTLRELGIDSGRRLLRRRPRRAAHARSPTRHSGSGPGPADESYLRADVIIETALRAGAEAIHPGYGFLAENAAFARAVEERRADVDRPAAGRDRADGLEDRGPHRDARRGRADHSRRHRARAHGRGGRRARRGDRLPADHQGGGRRRRQGDGARLRRGRGRAGLRGGATAGAEVLRRRHGLRRAVPREPAARRGADPRRRRTGRCSSSASATARSSGGTRS